MTFEAVHTQITSINAETIEHLKATGFIHVCPDSRDVPYDVDLLFVKNTGNYYIGTAIKGRGPNRIIITSADLDSLMVINSCEAAFEYLKGCAHENPVLTR